MVVLDFRDLRFLEAWGGGGGGEKMRFFFFFAFLLYIFAKAFMFAFDDDIYLSFSGRHGSYKSKTRFEVMDSVAIQEKEGKGFFFFNAVCLGF